MKKEIQMYLDGLEREKNITILLAVESGSRAWGFASENSDWDVRVIYTRDSNFYHSLNTDWEQTFETFVTDIDLDVHGWLLPKALRLLYKGNSAIHEWLGSPIVYRKNTAFFARMARLSTDYFNPLAAMWHYVELASGNYHRYIEDKDEYKLKRMLYVWRALMVSKYIHIYRTFPGTAITPLIAQHKELGVPTDIQTQVNKLLAMKKSGVEMGVGKWGDYSLLLEWLAAEIEATKTLLKAGEVQPVKNSIEPLNKAFRRFM